MISLYDMLEAADGQLFGEAAAHIFTDFAFELSQVEPGCLFVALKSERGDGHQLIAAAVERGALGVICTQPPGVPTDNVTVMIVREAEQALLNWARIVMQKYGTAVIAVTGAIGKSTTAAAIAAVLSTRYNVYTSTRGGIGRLGLPLALGRLGQQHELAVLELATEQSGEMDELMEIVHPLVSVVTGSHIPDTWPGEQEHLADELASLVSHLPDDGIAVLNYDDPGVRGLEERTRASVFSYGIDSFDADLIAYNIVIGRYKTGFDLRYAGERFVGKWVPLLGRHQLFNVMAALAVGLSYQVPMEDGLRALTQVDPLPGRMRPLNGVGGSLLIDDTYSASEQSTIAALEWLGSV
ncbi:MAG: hypothetical protein JW910_20960, partial [Anaerolineae bacterium]|nr:hypothetical protein [Anaerolineae bacterium]